MKKNAFKSILQKISGYDKVNVTEEDVYLVLKNIVVLNWYHWE